MVESDVLFVFNEARKLCGFDIITQDQLEEVSGFSKEFLEKFPARIGCTYNDPLLDFDDESENSEKLSSKSAVRPSPSMKAALIFSDFAYKAGHRRPCISYREDLGIAYLTWASMGWNFYCGNDDASCVNVREIVDMYPQFPAWLEKKDEYSLSLDDMTEWPSRLVRFIATVRLLYPCIRPKYELIF